MMSAVDYMLQRVAKNASGHRDAADQVCDQEDGFSLRYVEDADLTWLRWQAGRIVTEHRHYRGAGMMEPFNGTVRLFYLLGFGASREEAVAMAKEKGKV